MEGLDDYTSACEFYSKGLSLNPQSGFTRYFLNNNIGYSLNQLGRFADAEPYCRAAIEVEERCHNAYKNLGVSLTGQKRYAEASVCFVQATRARPTDRRALLCLERLVTEVPEILSLVPGLEKDLDDCRVLAQGSSPSRN
jgi:tetratricopeptide (TPR) repeat protein